MTFTCHINFSHPEHTSKEHGNNVMAEILAARCRQQFVSTAAAATRRGTYRAASEGECALERWRGLLWL